MVSRRGLQLARHPAGVAQLHTRVRRSDRHRHSHAHTRVRAHLLCPVPARQSRPDPFRGWIDLCQPWRSALGKWCWLARAAPTCYPLRLETCVYLAACLALPLSASLSLGGAEDCLAQEKTGASHAPYRRRDCAAEAGSPGAGGGRRQPQGVGSRARGYDPWRIHRFSLRLGGGSGVLRQRHGATTDAAPGWRWSDNSPPTASGCASTSGGCLQWAAAERASDDLAAAPPAAQPSRSCVGIAGWKMYPAHRCVSLLCVSAVCLCVSLLCVAVCLRRPSSGSPAVVHCPVPLLLRLPLPLLSLLRVPVRIVLWLRCERLSLPYPGRRLLLRWGIVRREVLRVAAATAAVRSHHFACSARGLFRSVWESEWQGRKVLVRRTGIVLSSAASDAPTALCHVPGGPLSN